PEVRFWEVTTSRSRCLCNRTCPSTKPSAESDDWKLFCLHFSGFLAVSKGCQIGAAYLFDSSISCRTEKSRIKRGGLILTKIDAGARPPESSRCCERKVRVYRQTLTSSSSSVICSNSRILDDCLPT